MNQIADETWSNHSYCSSSTLVARSHFSHVCTVHNNLIVWTMIYVHIMCSIIPLTLVMDSLLHLCSQYELLLLLIQTVYLQSRIVYQLIWLYQLSGSIYFYPPKDKNKIHKVQFKSRLFFKQACAFSYCFQSSIRLILFSIFFKSTFLFLSKCVQEDI